MDAIASKGAGFVGGVVGGHILPDEVAYVCREFYKWASGHRIVNGIRVHATLSDALDHAVSSRASWQYAKPPANEGPFLPYFAGTTTNGYLGPAGLEDGRDEEELKAMGDLSAPATIPEE